MEGQTFEFLVLTECWGEYWERNESKLLLNNFFPDYNHDTCSLRNFEKLKQKAYKKKL